MEIINVKYEMEYKLSEFFKYLLIFGSNILIFNTLLNRRGQLKQKNVVLCIAQIFSICYI